MSDPEAGPSNAVDVGAAPVFKKRSNRPRPHSRLASESRAASSEDVSTPELGLGEDGDTGATIEELIALRKLRQSKGGIDLHRLNEGEKKKRKKKAAPEDAPKFGVQQRDDRRIEEDDPEEGEARTRKILKADNFTGQTNAIDVDKHMMEYIETELKARRAKAIAEGTASASAPQPSTEEAIASLDPRDELYRIAEKYRIDKKPVVEGNVTLSAAMLTAVPEVDLGIETRLKNIEATEKAKRKLAEQEALLAAAAREEEVKEHFAADRFLLPNKQWSTDAEAMQIAKLESEGLTAEAEALRLAVKKAQASKYGAQGPPGAKAPGTILPGVGKKQLASDDRAVDNFRKRMANKK